MQVVAFFSCVGLLVLAVASPGDCAISSATDTCCLKVDSATRQLVDSTGRARIFHGVNVVYKNFPYYPTNSTFDHELSLNTEDIEFLVENGFNVVRLYVAWPGVEPKKGEYNHTYLKVLEDIVDRLGKAGIYTILDCHQDVWSPKFCGEGAPDYAALYTNRSIEPLSFPLPIPQLTPYKVDPDTGYPYRNECTKHTFFTYYFTDAVGKTWQSLYDNEQKIQDSFASFWQLVAKQFHDNPYVLGYELVNEPWAGDVYRHPEQLEPHVADPKNLMPMYQKLHSAIRQFDDRHVILFEPTIIITSLPFKNFANTGLTSGPGGTAYNDRQVLSYHMYCILLDSDGQPRSTLLCDGVDDAIVEVRMSDTKRLGVAGFMTEWGAYNANTVPGSRPYEDGLRILELADKYLQSWAYWQFKGYADFTTQSSTDEGLWFKNGTVQLSKLKLLSRTYAQAVSGRYVNQTFNPENGDFSVSFTAKTSLAPHPTEIYLNEKLYYPRGFSVNVLPSGIAQYSTSHNRATVTLDPHNVKDGENVTVQIKAK